jgi:hypothetical protein
MASRRSMCPNCGAPVGIPSLQANQPGNKGPLSREEVARRAQLAGPRPLDDANLSNFGPISVRLRRRRSNGNLSGGPDWRPLDAHLVCPPGAAERVRTLRRHRRWDRERRWYHCLLYPLRGWALVFGLGLMLTALTAAGSLMMPQLAEARNNLGQHWPTFMLTVVPILMLGYTAGFLDIVLTSAAEGQYGEVRWPGRDFRLVATAALKWVVCFLAGPIIFAAAAFAFWLYGEEPRFIDRVILGELVVLAFGGWLLALASVADAGSLWAALPENVVELVLRLGWRAVLPLAVAPLLLFFHARLGLKGIESLHRDEAGGAVLLAGAWIGLLFFGTFLLRLLGVWCHSTRQATAPENSIAEAVETSAEPASRHP